MSRSRTPALLLFALVLVGVATFAIARVRTANLRTLPYQGVLERDGVRITGPVTARFGLFASAGADTSCVVSNTCPLWSEEQVIDVVDGTFSVLLGEGTVSPVRPLTSAVLASPELFLAVAVKAGDDPAFVALSGVDEIVAAPLVQAGAATANSFSSNLFFSAKLTRFGTGYFVSEAFPADWIPAAGTQVGEVARLFPRQTFGVAGYTCTASSLGEPRVLTIQTASAGQIDVGVFNGNRVSSPGSFTLMCHGL